MMSQDADWNPYAGSQQAADALGEQPSTVPHTLGIFNIVFGVMLLLCVACYGMQVVMYGVLGTQMAANQQQVQQAMQQARQEEIDALDEAAENAETDEQADDLRAQRELLAKAPTPQMPDMSNMMGMKAEGVFPTYIFDCATGLILNVAMLISGIGLLKYRPWARKLAMWVAGLKLIRLIIICGLTITLVAPAVSTGFGDFMIEASKMNPQAPPPQQMQIDQVKTVYAWSITIWGIVLLVLGSIYPLITLWLLSRPHVMRVFHDKPQYPHPI